MPPITNGRRAGGRHSIAPGRGRKREVPDQLTLFDAGPPRKLHTRNPCTPYPIGSGPEGERCGTCRHLRRKNAHYTGPPIPGVRHYLKCGRMEHAWTYGLGTDIRAKWAACRGWRPTGFSGDDAIHRVRIEIVCNWLGLRLDTPYGVIADAAQEAGQPYGEVLAKLLQTDFLEAKTLSAKEMARGSPAASEEEGEIPF